MHLESLKITNFRKFGTENNRIEFVASKNGSNKIASSTTLVVGKNNTGKTTVTKALKRLVSDSTDFLSNDFNYGYLKGIMLAGIESPNFAIKAPEIEFEISIRIESDDQTLLTNIGRFIDTSLLTDTTGGICINIIVKYQVVESAIFQEGFKKIAQKYEGKEDIIFKKFLDLIDRSKFKSVKFHGEDLMPSEFSLNKLIDIKIIGANNNLHDKNLSNIFNRIIRKRYLNDQGKIEKLIDEIDSFNLKISSTITEDHNSTVNNTLHSIHSNKRLGVLLSSSLNFEKLTRDLIKHEYKEMGFHIPESQFGLGYTNLLNIIAEIIEYVDDYPVAAGVNKIHIVCIEEPEAFMHPQMQEGFIKSINNAVDTLLTGSEKKFVSQLLITTHSSHILNSKIHYSNSFDSINYLFLKSNIATSVKLTDSLITDSSETDEEKKIKDLNFLKKHVKLKVSELFFSDAVIFVEGPTEEAVLVSSLENDTDMNKFYISIFNINGAHGLVYLPLVKQLGVPCLIVTDIDVKRTKNEKENYTQLNDLQDRTTTNKTIKKLKGNESLSTGLSYFGLDNLYCVFQKDAVEGFFSTSFEEAYILTNYKNILLHKVIKYVKPEIFQDIVGDLDNFEELKNNSYKMQRKLAGSKTEFANQLLYEVINKNDDDILPELPRYIKDGLDWLKARMTEDLEADAEESEELPQETFAGIVEEIVQP